MHQNHSLALENHRNILELKKKAARSFILLGKELKWNKEQRYFESLGYPTFEAYISSSAVDLGRRSVYSLIAIYSTFVEELGYSEDELALVDYSKLDRVIPVINMQPVAHRKWFEKALALPRRELEQEVKQAFEAQNKRLPKPDPPKLPSEELERWLNTIQCGECLELLRQLPDESIDCCVTSPPYWALRDYGVEDKLGTEATFGEYLEKLCAIFDEVSRVLKTEGTCWINMGDTYSRGSRSKDRINHGLNKQSQHVHIEPKFRPVYPNDKCLLQIPSRFAIKMCNQGWILRNKIIWHKPNCMPASVTDRFTVDFEELFFFVKSRAYWFSQQYEPAETNENRPHGVVRNRIYGYQGKYKVAQTPEILVKKGNGRNLNVPEPAHRNGRNKRTVWTIPTKTFPDAHFVNSQRSLLKHQFRQAVQKTGSFWIRFVEVEPRLLSLKSWEGATSALILTPTMLRWRRSGSVKFH